MNIQDGFAPRSVKPFWHDLLRTLSQACCEDAIVMYVYDCFESGGTLTSYILHSADTPFVAPKGHEGAHCASLLIGLMLSEDDLIRISTNVDEDKEELELTTDALTRMDQVFSTSATTIDGPLAFDATSNNESLHLNTVAMLPSSPHDGIGEPVCALDEDTDPTSDEDQDEDIDRTGSADSDKNRLALATRDPPKSIYSAQYNTAFRFADMFSRYVSADDADCKYGFASELDIPHQAHIFPRLVNQSDLCFPILCVAEDQDIVPLVASLVCLRTAWKIDVPVIGLQMSKFNGNVKVYVGWLDPISKSNPENLVRIFNISICHHPLLLHLACTDTGTI